MFRSAAPEFMTDQGWRAAKAAGLRTVIDLRNAVEAGRGQGHPVISTESLDGLVFVPAPTEDPGDAGFLRVCGPWLDHPGSWAGNARLAPERITAATDARRQSAPISAGSGWHGRQDRDLLPRTNRGGDGCMGSSPGSGPARVFGLASCGCLREPDAGDGLGSRLFCGRFSSVPCGWEGLGEAEGCGGQCCREFTG